MLYGCFSIVGRKACSIPGCNCRVESKLMASTNVKVVPFRTLSTVVRVASGLKAHAREFFFLIGARTVAIHCANAFRSCTDREIVINYSGGAQGRPLILSRGSFTPISRYQTTITSRLTLSFVRHKRFINHVNGEWGQFTLQAIPNDGSLYSSSR